MSAKKAPIFFVVYKGIISNFVWVPVSTMNTEEYFWKYIKNCASPTLQHLCIVYGGVDNPELVIIYC